MRAVVLVGGEGTRLRPLTYTRPKQMLPIVGVTMIERVLAYLATYGVTDAVLSLGYQPRAFLDAFPTGVANGVRLEYAVEPEPLDTAGAIRFAAVHAGYDRSTDPFFVVNGDVLCRIDLHALERVHYERRASATIALTEVDDPSRFGVVPTDEHGKVLGFIEKPPRAEAPTRWINAGHYVLSPSVLSRIPEGRKVSIERETFPALSAEGSLYAVQSPAYWIDTGTPETYVQSQLDQLEGASAIAASARVHPDATVELSVVGADAVVDRGAVVRRSVLLPRAHVQADATVEDCAIGEGAVVGAGARLDQLCVLGDGYRVPDAARMSGERLGGPPPSF